MPQDYNIYIHSDEGKGVDIGKNTVPFANQENVDDNAFNSIKSGIQKAESIATGGFGGVINTGVAALGRAIPQIALIVAAGAVANKVVTTGFQHLECYTGNFEYSLGLNNFKAAIGRTLNPIGTFFKAQHIQAQAHKQNAAIREGNRLFGLTRTKIGV